MGAAEAVPFGDRAAAEAFVAANGGKIVTFADIPSAYVLGSDTSGDQAEHSDVRPN
jgi:copper chaperone NosL